MKMHWKERGKLQRNSFVWCTRTMRSFAESAARPFRSQRFAFLGDRLPDIDRGQRPPDAPPEDEIELLIEERNDARKQGNYAQADQIRNLLKLGCVVLMDEKGRRGQLTGQEVTQWRYLRDDPKQQ